MNALVVRDTAGKVRSSMFPSTRSQYPPGDGVVPVTELAPFVLLCPFA